MSLRGLSWDSKTCLAVTEVAKAVARVEAAVAVEVVAQGMAGAEGEAVVGAENPVGIPSAPLSAHN